MRRTVRSLLLSILALTLSGTAALPQTGSLQETRTPGTPPESFPASRADGERMRAELLEIVHFQATLLQRIPERSDLSAMLVDIEAQVRALDDDELAVFSQATAETPGWTSSLGQVRVVMSTLPPPAVSRSRSGPQQSPGPRPELGEYFYGGPEDPIPPGVVYATFLVWKVIGGVGLIAQAICDASPSGCLCPINSVSCTVAGVAKALEWGAQGIYDEWGMVNGDTESTNVYNLLLYAESLHDLTSDNVRYTDDVERSAQTQTLIDKMNLLEGKLDDLQEGQNELKETQDLMFRVINSMFDDQRQGHNRLTVLLYDVRRTCQGGGLGSAVGDITPSGAGDPAGALSLQRALTEGTVLPSLYLPRAEGGLIEDVQQAVWAAIEAHVSLGYEMGRTERARELSARADRLLEQGDFANACHTYGLAFRELIPEAGSEESPVTATAPGRVGDAPLDMLVEGGAHGMPRPLLTPPVPNPATGRLSYTVNLSDAAPVRVRVYDVSGKLVDELVNEHMAPGQHDLAWQPGENGETAPSGVYFLNVEAGELRASRQFVLVR